MSFYKWILRKTNQLRFKCLGSGSESGYVGSAICMQHFGFPEPDPQKYTNPSKYPSNSAEQKKHFNLKHKIRTNEKRETIKMFLITEWFR